MVGKERIGPKLPSPQRLPGAASGPGLQQQLGDDGDFFASKKKQPQPS
jgi:hypothetical protein